MFFYFRVNGIYILFLILFLLAFVFSSIDKVLVERIYLEISKGNLYEAEKIVYEVFREDPNNVDALFAKSIIIISYADESKKFEKYKESLEILDSIHKKLAGFYYYHFIRAKNLEKLNRIDDSLKEYNNSIYYNPNFTDAYVSKSYLYWKINDIDNAFKSVEIIKDKYKAKMLISWYHYQLYNYDKALELLEEILDNTIQMKEINQSRKVLNELYFQLLWINYRANRKNSYWIEQNKKYNNDEYYSFITDVFSNMSNLERAAKSCLYCISKFPNKPYAYFILYQILKVSSTSDNKNYLFFLKKAVELDLYNLDFRKVLEKELKKVKY